MKTIYNLQIGDSFFTTGYNDVSGKKGVKRITIDWFTKSCYEERLKVNEVWLTKEECQRSIDYDVALAKINKYVSEFSDAPDTMSEIVFNSHPQEIGFYIIERNGYVTQSSPLVFKTKNAHRVLKELPNEVKTVLGVK